MADVISTYANLILISKRLNRNFINIRFKAIELMQSQRIVQLQVKVTGGFGLIKDLEDL